MIESCILMMEPELRPLSWCRSWRHNNILSLGKRGKLSGVKLGMYGGWSKTKPKHWIGAVVLTFVCGQALSCWRRRCSMRTYSSKVYFQLAQCSTVPLIVNGYDSRHVFLMFISQVQGDLCKLSNTKMCSPALNSADACTFFSIYNLTFASKCWSQARFLPSGNISLHAIVCTFISIYFFFIDVCSK
jgi:hypothetical protein